MDFRLLECFLALADEMHFGRAAQRQGMTPSAFGRNIRLLEEQLGVRLFARSTRNVSFTSGGEALLTEARDLIERAAAALERVRSASRRDERVFRIGAIDSAATGLIPRLVHDLKKQEGEVKLVLVEDKTIRLVPKLLSGALDIAFVRPPAAPNPAIVFEKLLNEPTVVALPASHLLTAHAALTVQDLAGLPLIVPSPRSRPHSYSLTMRLFVEAGLRPVIVQQAEEKQTIVTLIGAGVGAALVPYWTSRISAEGVTYRPLCTADGRAVCELPLAAAWVRATYDPFRDALMDIVRRNLATYLT